MCIHVQQLKNTHAQLQNSAVQDTTREFQTHNGLILLFIEKLYTR